MIRTNSRISWKFFGLQYPRPAPEQMIAPCSRSNAICFWSSLADPQPKAVRGFIPARTDEERYLMRHIEDLAHTAFSRDIARYSAFLSDREQDLARATW